MPRGRERTPIGHYGKMTTVEVEPKRWESRCWFRDFDGVSRRVRATGPSRIGAENALKRKLGERSHHAGSQLTGSSRLEDAAELWLAQQRALVEAGDRSPRTYDKYESDWRLHVAPALGQLRLSEARTSRCEAWLVALRKRKGPSTCATARAVLGAVLGLAARMEAIPTNPVRDLSPIPGAKSRKRKPRKMTLDERRAWLDWLDNHVAHDPAQQTPRRPELDHSAAEVIAGRALGDITRLGFATGARVGELMAVSWDEFNPDAGTIAICWHLVRVKGHGLVRMEGAKSDAGDRVLKLPRWAVTMLVRRKLAAPPRSYPIFPDSCGQWRDPNLVIRWLRWSRIEAERDGVDGAVSHVARQTVITHLDDKGLRPREVADQAGHAKESQSQEYMARKVASEAAAAALEDII